MSGWVGEGYLCLATARFSLNRKFISLNSCATFIGRPSSRLAVSANCAAYSLRDEVVQSRA
jgi:hypothetical protein